MDGVDVLVGARAYIDKGWTQGWLARNEHGFECGATSPEARSWCLLGALEMTVGLDGDEVETAQAALLLLSEVRGINVLDLATWNDAAERTKEDVLEAFDGAIALGLQREPA